jgi:hypothetical protein
MLLIVVNHKRPQNQQTRQKAAQHFAREMEVPLRANESGGQENPS